MKIQIVALFLCLSFAVHAQNETYAEVNKVDGIDETYKITAFAVESDNTKYIGTDKGLLKISPQGVVESVISGKNIRAVEPHSSLGVWVAIEPNILYNVNSGQSITIDEPEVQINTMDFSGNKLWVGTNNGVYVVGVEDGNITDHYTPDNSKLQSLNVNTIYIEKSRLKWIGTDRGLARVDNEKWKLYEKGRRINAVTENFEGVWIASDDEIWLIDATNRWIPYSVDDGLGEGNVRGLASDGKGTIYILSNVLIQFDPYNDESIEIDYEHGEVSDQAVIMVDAEEKLWIGSLESGLLSMNLEESDLELSCFAHVEHPGCPGQASGAISISAEGGSPPYTFSWENTLIEGNEVKSLPAGVYRVMVEDSEDQLFPLKIELIDPQPLSATVETTQAISSPGNNDGRASVNVSGGSGNYVTKWSDGTVGSDRGGLSAGQYTIEVTDGRGCKTTLDFVIEDGIAVEEEAEPVVTSTPPSNTATPPPPSKPIDAVDATVLKTLTVSSLAVGQTLRIEQLTFPADSTTITPESHVVLDEVYTFLENNPAVVIEIGGHTNGLPEHDYCDRLSNARAQNVAEYLYTKGIPEDRIGYKGYGKRKPVATNSTVAGRRKNQRVEIKIIAM